MVPGSPGKAEQGGGRSSRSRGSARSERRRAIQTALAAINFRAADTHRGCKKFFGLTFPTGRPIRDAGVPVRLPARRPMAARRSASLCARPPPTRPPPLPRLPRRSDTGAGAHHRSGLRGFPQHPPRPSLQAQILSRQTNSAHPMAASPAGFPTS